MTRLSRFLLTVSITGTLAYLVLVRREDIAVPMITLLGVLAWMLVDWIRTWEPDDIRGFFQDMLSNARWEIKPIAPIKDKEWLQRVLTYSGAYELREWRKSVDPDGSKGINIEPNDDYPKEKR